MMSADCFPLPGLGTPALFNTLSDIPKPRITKSKSTRKNSVIPSKPTSPHQLLHGWGDPLSSIDEITILRVVYQNVNGFSTTDPKNKLICHNMQQIQCGIFLAAETNVNWRNRKMVDKFKEYGNKVWPNHRLIVSSHSCGTDPAHRNSQYLPGGVAIWVNDYWATRVLDCGSDPHGLGRWCFVTIGTKGGVCVTIFCVYRVCVTENSGTSTIRKRFARFSSV